MEDRIVDLESRLAWQEDTLRALNDVIVDQEKRIERLEALNRELLERVRQFAVLLDTGNPPLDEKPPHH
jgi:SlyX protein